MAKGNSLKPLNRRKVVDRDLAGIVKELRGVSDRSAAIVLGSLVERELEQLIIQALPKKEDHKAIAKLQERDGALSSFFGKIHLGYALDLYDEKTRDNLDAIRQVGNTFARTAQEITFETQEIRAAVARLHKSQLVDGSDLKILSEHRRKFTAACGQFMATIRLRPVDKKLEIMTDDIGPAQPRLSKDTLPPDLVEKLSNAVEAIKALDDKQRSK